jgi:hypothetical protein
MHRCLLAAERCRGTINADIQAIDAPLGTVESLASKGRVRSSRGSAQWLRRGSSRQVNVADSGRGHLRRSRSERGDGAGGATKKSVG